ncbi:hypothetical protein D3C80_2053680 [compost metagenome]
MGRIMQMTKGKIFWQSGIDRTDGALVILVDFSVVAIEFKPVAVVRNMAARNHDAWRLLRNRKVAQCRGWQNTAIDRLKPRILNCRHAKC